MNVTAIQIISVEINILSSFPRERVGQLISELNVHYGKINNYLVAKVGRERIDVEVIDSLAKLEEIDRLAPHGIGDVPQGGDYRLSICLLDSIIALLNTEAGHADTRRKLISLGRSLLGKLYRFSYERLQYEALRFGWLKSNDLVKSQDISRWERPMGAMSAKIKFSPSKDEIEIFYKEHKQEIYRYMIFEMSSDKAETDPFSQAGAADYYHYHQTLANMHVHTA